MDKCPGLDACHKVASILSQDWDDPAMYTQARRKACLACELNPHKRTGKTFKSVTDFVKSIGGGRAQE